tara:strand:+ start:2527 stop:4080 length:1554 start_codon:yes stop_codon:yes gene_type:complete
MPSHITDQFRIINSNNFIGSIKRDTENYYTWLGLPDPTNSIVGGSSGWNSNPPNPIDNFKNQNDYHDTMLFFKKITEEHVSRVIRRINWESGQKYDMYRHDISINKLSNVTNATSLYTSNYVVINSDFRVYICLQNGTDENNPNGRPSLDQPVFTDLQPKSAGSSGDGYIWKYLYTIKPSDIIKFVTKQFIPVPNNWGSGNTQEVKDASVSGKIETVLISSSGNSNYTPGVYTNVPIKGDGEDAVVSIVVSSSGKISSVNVTNGGSGYTSGIIEFDSNNISSLNSGTGAVFDVIIPPKGGHGNDIYRELGSNKVMINTVFDNNSSDNSLDYIIGNDFARIGIIYNPTVTSTVSNTGTALGAIKLRPSTANSGDSISDTTYSANDRITQTVSAGTTATAYVASWDANNGILRYYQPVGIATFTNNKLHSFAFDPNSESNNTILGASVGNSLVIDQFSGNSNVNTETGVTIPFGIEFVNGLASSEISPKYSGDVIYVDNRASVPRSQNQKEDIKIVLEF